MDFPNFEIKFTKLDIFFASSFLCMVVDFLMLLWGANMLLRDMILFLETENIIAPLLTLMLYLLWGVCFKRDACRVIWCWFPKQRDNLDKYIPESMRKELLQ